MRPIRSDRPTCAGDELTELDLDSGREGAGACNESCEPATRLRGWDPQAGLGVLDLDTSIMGWRLERRTWLGDGLTLFRDADARGCADSVCGWP